jgi:DNA-directed RNA polymerase beta subunit
VSWEAAEAYLKAYPLAKQHLDSYNQFVDVGIQKIIDELGVIESHQEGIQIKLGKARLEKPRVLEADGSRRKILPMEARLRNRSYVSQVFLEMTLVQDGVEKNTEEVFIAELPVMLHSKLCYLSEMSRDELAKAGEDSRDAGGYFVINGSERVLVAIEDLAPNRTIISREKRSGKDVIMVRIFSVKDGFRAKVGVERKPDGLFYVSFPASPKNLNIVPVLKALGLGHDADIFKAFHDKPQIVNDILLNIEAVDVKDQKEAIDYIGKRVAAGQPEEYRKMRALQILDSYLLPHVGVDENARMRKAFFLCRMIEKATSVANDERDEDDKDHYANKRVKLSGALMEELFRYGLSYFVKDVNYQIDRVFARGKKLQIRTLVRPDAMTDRIRYAMATGNWVGGRTGVSQLLDRTTFLSELSHMRRVISPLSKVHPHFEARDLHPTHIFKLCPNETPEGQSCGLVKNFAIGTLVTTGHPEQEIEKQLAKLGVSFKGVT